MKTLVKLPKLLRVLEAALAAVLFFPACSSEPCVGPSCPDACGGIDCDALTGAASTGRFAPCATSASCDEASGFACVAGECRYACRSHFDCEGLGTCEPLASGGQELGTFCKLASEPFPDGQYYARCPSGTECDARSGFACVGAGAGDLDGYCTSDCAADRDCPSGFYCDGVRSGAGTRLLCVPRGFCAPCEVDADCLATPGGVCLDHGDGERGCSARCEVATGSCPWGAAAECVAGGGRADGVCRHRFGACRGEGRGCEPCTRDADCPTGVCSGSGFTGERWCVDFNDDCSCPGSSVLCEGANGCSPSPSGLGLACVVPEQGAPVCVGASDSGGSISGSGQLGCWQRLAR